MEKQHRAGVRSRLRKLLDACRAERWNVSRSVKEVVEIAANALTPRHEKKALKWGSAQVISNLGQMCAKRYKVGLAVQMADVQESAEGANEEAVTCNWH